MQQFSWLEPGPPQETENTNMLVKGYMNSQYWFNYEESPIGPFLAIDGSISYINTKYKGIS